MFKLTEFNALQEHQKHDPANNDNFKCLLVNHPVLDEVYDFSSYSNFMIASGISREAHYIKEIKFASIIGKANEDYFADVLELFNSLAYPAKEKDFYVPTIRMDSLVLKDVTITQEKSNDWYYGTQKLSIKGFVGDSYYRGYAKFALSSSGPELTYTTIALGYEDEGAKYRADYEKSVSKHVKKQHQHPLHIPELAFA